MRSENLGPTPASLSFRPFPERSHRPQVLEITIPARPAPSEGLHLTPSVQGEARTDKNGPLDWYLQAAGTLRERKTCHYYPKDPASNSGAPSHWSLEISEEEEPNQTRAAEASKCIGHRALLLKLGAAPAKTYLSRSFRRKT